MMIRRFLAILLVLMVIGAAGPALADPASAATVGAEPSATALETPSGSVTHVARRGRVRHRGVKVRRSRWARVAARQVRPVRRARAHAAGRTASVPAAHRKPARKFASSASSNVAPRIAVTANSRPVATAPVQVAATAAPMASTTAAPAKPVAAPVVAPVVTPLKRAAAPVARPGHAASAKAPAAKAPVAGPLAGTKSDPFDQTQESPAATAGSAFKMMLYLIPVLLLVSLAIRGLKGAQTRVGSMSSMKSLFSGGAALGGGRHGLGNAIRVLESTRVGASTIHLVDVRGRSLLLCSNGTNVSVLADVTASAGAGATEFSQVMSEAAADLGDLGADDASIAGIVGSLDSRLRDARECVTRSSARVRGWGDGGTDDVIR